ncbi:hypothetical protein GCM10022239_00790 [Leifsonia bigeumensis]|uniref:GIY-YIG domain-containing protein n=1 Tax=Leifsonella bigeumensis TaxID=433643 RepID=A0ABP7EYG3_9MICO
MTGFEIRRVAFEKHAVREWGKKDQRHRNWPVVYVIDAAGKRRQTKKFVDVYVGETVNAESRILQHLGTPGKRQLSTVHVVLDDTYNKSACLDLESHLVRLLAGDGTYRVLNGNDGVIDADYYDRDTYRESFRDVFERLRDEGIFTRSIPEIENSDCSNCHHSKR